MLKFVTFPLILNNEAEARMQLLYLNICHVLPKLIMDYYLLQTNNWGEWSGEEEWLHNSWNTEMTLKSTSNIVISSALQTDEPRQNKTETICHTVYKCFHDNVTLYILGRDEDWSVCWLIGLNCHVSREYSTHLFLQC